MSTQRPYREASKTPQTAEQPAAPARTSSEARIVAVYQPDRDACLRALTRVIETRPDR